MRGDAECEGKDQTWAREAFGFSGGVAAVRVLEAARDEAVPRTVFE